MRLAIYCSTSGLILDRSRALQRRMAMIIADDDRHVDTYMYVYPTEFRIMIEQNSSNENILQSTTNPDYQYLTTSHPSRPLPLPHRQRRSLMRPNRAPFTTTLRPPLTARPLKPTVEKRIIHQSPIIAEEVRIKVLPDFVSAVDFSFSWKVESQFLRKTLWELEGELNLDDKCRFLLLRSWFRARNGSRSYGIGWSVFASVVGLGIWGV